jgi:hypothetical protein
VDTKTLLAERDAESVVSEVPQMGLTKRTMFEIVLFKLDTLFFMCKKGP